MYISTKFEFAFLCLPKCASTSIEAAIAPFCNIMFTGQPSLKHINVKAYDRYIAPLHNNRVQGGKLESFCIMREPLNWINSWYRYLSREELANPQHPQHQKYTGNMSYEEFIEAYLSSGKRPSYANISRPHEFVINATGKIGIDRIFPLEKIDKIEEFLSNKLRNPVALPKKNISPKGSAPLNQELKRKLQNHFKKDIEVHNFALERGSYNRRFHSKALSF